MIVIIKEFIDYLDKHGQETVQKILAKEQDEARDLKRRREERKSKPLNKSIN